MSLKEVLTEIINQTHIGIIFYAFEKEYFMAIFFYFTHGKRTKPITLLFQLWFRLIDVLRNEEDDGRLNTTEVTGAIGGDRQWKVI